MVIMAERKKPSVPKPRKASQEPRVGVFLSLDAETHKQLQAYVAAQDVKPPAAAVGLKALREFLVSRGFRKP
jgi:hypothetical protein